MSRVREQSFTLKVVKVLRQPGRCNGEKMLFKPKEPYENTKTGEPKVTDDSIFTF